MMLLKRFKIYKFLNFFLKKFNLKINFFIDSDFFDFKKFIYSYITNKDCVNFVQLGGNDGIINDPIYDICKKYPNKLNGHIFEPVPEYFNDLKKNYKFSKNINLYNFAIHNELTSTIIYKVKKNSLNKVDNLAKGIASFEKDWWKTKSNFIKDPDMIEGIKVECVHTNFITTKLNLKFIDILIIDTEGYDYEIIKKFDFKKILPNIIHFEHGLIDRLMTNDQFNEIKNILYNYNYDLIYQNYDLTAYQMKSLLN